ncbi:MAG: Nif3-like dinuclear metal center hexameric protein [Malacoplasma sp.]|nr:Nif3-like dinuclear metal center hexameric protein [Malacoplasma sp.]
MKIKQIYELFDNEFNVTSQEEWDNSGLIAFNNDPNVDANNPVLSLDVNQEVVEYAIKNNSNLIISHHPIFLDHEVSRMQPYKLLLKLIKEHNIFLIALHTCFDKHQFGTSYQIVKHLKDFEIKHSLNSDFLVFGISKIALSLNDLIAKLKTNLDLEYVNLLQNQNFDFNQKFKNLKIAVAAGAGCSELDNIYKKDKIDFFISSEVKWHMWNNNLAQSFKILEIPHSVEKVFINAIAKKFKQINFLTYYPFKISKF